MLQSYCPCVPQICTAGSIRWECREVRVNGTPGLLPKAQHERTRSQPTDTAPGDNLPELLPSAGPAPACNYLAQLLMTFSLEAVGSRCMEFCAPGRRGQQSCGLV